MSLSPPKRTPPDEQRLIVLCALDHLAPCTELQLLQFLFEYDLMNYFDMMFALNDLCANGQAVRREERAGHLYALTDAGREALTLFGSRVPPSVQTLLEEQGGAWRSRFAAEGQFLHQIRQTKRGEYELTLTIAEQDMDMMKLSLVLPTRELAQQLADGWPKKGGALYEQVIRTLSQEEQA